MKTLAAFLLLTMLSHPAMAEVDCKAQVANIFANLISVENGVSVKASKIEIGELTAYEWTIYTTLSNGKYVEYLADVDPEVCKISSMIEANGEQPSYDRHWKKQE